MIRVLCVGGLDPAGGAGITADARVAGAHAAHPLTVMTCSTVQNRHRFERLWPVEEDHLLACLRAAQEDGPIDAVKVGLCGTAATVEAVFSFLLDVDAPVVVDPVLGSTAPGFAASEALVRAYEAVLPQVTVLTPNLPEVRRLVGEDPSSLLATGCEAVLVTGGHGEGSTVEDRLFTSEGTLTLRHPRLDVGPVHGTGCALSTALACRLAEGRSIEDAAREAVQTVAGYLGRTPASVDGLPVVLVVG